MYFVSVVMVGRGGVAREETNVVILLLIGGGVFVDIPVHIPPYHIK